MGLLGALWVCGSVFWQMYIELHLLLVGAVRCGQFAALSADEAAVRIWNWHIIYIQYLSNKQLISGKNTHAISSIKHADTQVHLLIPSALEGYGLLIFTRNYLQELHIFVPSDRYIVSSPEPHFGTLQRTITRHPSIRNCKDMFRWFIFVFRFSYTQPNTKPSRGVPVDFDGYSYWVMKLR